MLEIIQCRDIDKYSGLIKKLGIKKNVNVSEAVDGESVIGFCVYSFSEKEVVLHYFDYGKDIYLLDGIIRSVLFLAMVKGIDRAVFETEDYSDIKKLGFVQNNYNCIDSIDKFMCKCKSCKN